MEGEFGCLDLSVEEEDSWFCQYIEISEVRAFSIPVFIVERSGNKEDFAQCRAP